MQGEPDTAGLVAAQAEANSVGSTLTFSSEVAAYVRKHYETAASILEYGSGGSTIMAAELGKPVVSVESGAAWADALASRLAAVSSSAHVHHVDIGPTKAWGYPASTEAANRFHTYALSVWDLPDLIHPDVVLIDGRFRKACFAATMMRITRPVTVLFDDYKRRGTYHAVEQLAPRRETVERMARFDLLPGVVPHQLMTEVIGWFCDPT